MSQERRLARGGGPTLAYEVVEPGGAGPSSRVTILCLHGNGGHRGIWRPVARALGDFRIVLVDARGHGDSDHVSPPAYDPEHHAADVAAIVRRAVDGPYAVLAHSAGALAAARFITDAGIAAGAAMPAAFVWVDLDPEVPRWQVDYFRQGAASVARTFATVEAATRGLRRMYPKIPDERLQSFVTEGLRRAEGGFRMKLDPATYETWEPGDLRPALPRIGCPTLVLRGAESVVTSPEGLAALAHGLRTHEIREIAGGSHMLPLEQPEAVASAVRDFIERHVTR